jgi:antitoxin component YwqK of YwqJK toxin-antitoxin module
MPFEADRQGNLRLREYYKDGSIEWGIPYTGDERSRNKRRHGTARQYWPNGNVKIERQYDRGNVVGTEKMFYPDGTPWQTTEYVDGRKDGAYKTFHKNGDPDVEAEYEQDEKVGDFRRFAPGRKKIQEMKLRERKRDRGRKKNPVR